MQKIPLSIAETIVITSVRLKTIANRFIFSPTGITGAKFRILRMIYCEGQKRPSEIMKFAGGTKSNVSQRLNSLEKEGFIRRLPPKKCGDRRNVLVEITPSGKDLVGKLLNHFRHSTDALNRYFSPQEIEAQFAFIKKLNCILDEQEKEIPKFFEK